MSQRRIFEAVGAGQAFEKTTSHVAASSSAVSRAVNNPSTLASSFGQISQVHYSSNDRIPATTRQHQSLSGAISSANPIVVSSTASVARATSCLLPGPDISAQMQMRSTRKIPFHLDRYGIYCLDFSPDGQNLAVGFGNGGVYVLPLNKAKTIPIEVMHSHRKNLATMALKYNRDQTLLFGACSSGEINVWNVQTSAIEPQVTLKEEENEIYTLDVCRDGTFFATAGKDRHIRLYDAHSLTLYHTIFAPQPETTDEISILTGHTQRVFALKFHPEENHIFLTAGWDNSMKVWDKRMAKAARKSIPGPHICGCGLDLMGNKILTGSWCSKNALQLWDLRAGALDRTVPFPHVKNEGEFLYCAKFTNAQTVVAGGSGTNNACVINIDNNELLYVIDNNHKAVLAVDSLKEGNIIACAGLHGHLQISTLQELK